jgi:hypothetical protein
MALSRKTYKRTVDLLTPYLDQGNRQSLCQLAFAGTPLINQINYSGANAQFATHIIDKALKFGTLDDGTLALVALLEALQEQVGGNVTADIDTLITTIRVELSATPDNGSDDDNSMIMLIAVAGMVLVLVLFGGGWLLFGRGGANVAPSPAIVPAIVDEATAMPLSPATTTAPLTTDTETDAGDAGNLGSVTVELFYSDTDGLYVIVTDDSDLRGLTLVTDVGRYTLTDDFIVLNSVSGQVEAGTCLRYIQAETAPVPPRRCSGDNVFETSLNAGDVFWYDFSSNRLLDVTVLRGDTVVKLCPAGNPCEVAVSE